MSVVESLPPRPLDPEELLQLNSAGALDLAVPIEDDGRVTGVLVATDSGVKGLALGLDPDATVDADADAAGWTVVEAVELDAETERVDGLQACEAAILRFRGDDPDAVTPADAPGAYEPTAPESDEE